MVLNHSWKKVNISKGRICRSQYFYYLH